MASTDAVAPALVKIFTAADPLGEKLKDEIVRYLRGKPQVEVVDHGTESYYSAAQKVGQNVAEGFAKHPATSQGATPGDDAPCASAASAAAAAAHRGIVVCGTGAGVCLAANKVQGVTAVFCDSADAAKNARSINNCNVLALSGLHTPPENAKTIVDAWLATNFKDPCPANKNEPWSEEIHRFLDESLPVLVKMGGGGSAAGSGAPPPAAASAPATVAAPAAASAAAVAETCPICDLAAGRVYDAVGEMPGGSWKVIRQNPTTAVVKFVAGSVEPAHHHDFSHDIIVLRGHKLVQNLAQKSSHELRDGDFLSTPAGQIHRVYYFTDTEFFIKWDGPANILMDEDFDAARAALADVMK